MIQLAKPALAAILLFVISSASSPGQSPGRVNGTPIDQAEFDERVSEQVTAMRERRSPVDPDEAMIREVIWNQMVDEILIQQAADSLHVGISDQQLHTLLLEEPPEFLRTSFTDSAGTFQSAIYREFIDTPEAFLSAHGATPEEVRTTMRQLTRFLETFRRDRLREAVERAVTSSIAVTPADAFAEYRRQMSRASGSVAVLKATLITDADAAIGESEARAYFDAHRSEFTRHASREIHFALFSPNMSHEDSSVAESRLNEARRALSATTSPAARESLHATWTRENGAGSWDAGSAVAPYELPREIQPFLKDARARSIIGPLWLADGLHMVEVAAIGSDGDPYVSAQHILLTIHPGQNADSVRALAGKIIKRARSGESFEQLARLYSGDPSSSERGGDLGYFAKGMMVEPFEKASFSAKPGTITGPIRTTFGYHIIKVNDRGSKSFRLNDWKIEPGLPAPAREALRRRAEGFRHALLPGSSIDSVGRSENVMILESGPVRRNDPVAGSMRLGSFTFSSPVGAISDVVELNDGSLVIAQVARINSAGAIDYGAAREMIMTRLGTRRKVEMLAGDATIFRAWLASGRTLEELKQIDPRPEVHRFEDLSPSAPFPGIGIDSALTDAVFGMKPGELSQPIRGELGCYIVRLTHLRIPTETEFVADRERFIEQLSNQRRASLLSEWMASRREQANIEGFPPSP